MTVLDLASRWDQIKRGEPLDVVPPVPSVPTEPQEFRHYRPLVDAADDYIRYAQSPHEQVYTGIRAIDREMRGIAPGEVCMITGYSHAGKTLLLMEVLRHNADRNVLYFCPDEPRTLTLIKLACLQHNINALELEQRVREHDEEAIQLLRDTAVRDFPNLAVFDDPVSLADMQRATEEATAALGGRPDLVVFDYLELLMGGGEDVPSKANALKAWGRRHDVPLLLLHQVSRSAGADGRSITISSGAYGGEQQATHIIGVRRKLFEIRAQIKSLEERIAAPGRQASAEALMLALDGLRLDERIHQHTLTVNLVKNKRVGGKLVDDVDFEINHGTGRLTPLVNGDLPIQYRMREFD